MDALLTETEGSAPTRRLLKAFHDRGDMAGGRVGWQPQLFEREVRQLLGAGDPLASKQSLQHLSFLWGRIRTVFEEVGNAALKDVGRHARH